MTANSSDMFSAENVSGLAEMVETESKLAHKIMWAN